MHPKHCFEFENLADRMHSVVRGRPIIFVINPGNWGDALIREGAERFLRHFDFDYISVHLNDIEKGRVNLSAIKQKIGHDDPVLIYNGCGAFSPHYNMIQRVQRLAGHFSSVVLLPCTINIDMGVHQFPDDTHIFVRDLFESKLAVPEAQFCHDMAFFLELPACTSKFRSGYFFRTDREAPTERIDVPAGEKNRDLSKDGRAQYPIDGFMRAIGDYSTIHTNRLHIGIAASLLSRETYLYPGDYFKIRAIFDSSISDVFPWVKLIEGHQPIV